MVKRTSNLLIVLGLSLLLSACANEEAIDSALTDDNAMADAPLRIAAAANLAEVLPDIIADYQASKDMASESLPSQNIEVTYASSGKLYAQIIAGAPYDIFLSADQALPAKLVADGFTKNSSQAQNHQLPFTYARGQLALYSVSLPISKDNNNELTALDKLDSLFDINTHTNANTNIKVAIANPELAPYGASAKAYLQAQQVYEQLNEQKRLIQAENIGQAFQYDHSGSVDYGFVAQSQVVAIKATPKQFITLEPDTYPAILQDGIVINATPLAIDFSNYLRTPAAQSNFANAGYLAVN